MAGIRNILFDLGNVLLPISYERCFHAFQQFSGEQIDMEWFAGVSKNIFEEQEVGKLDDTVFFDLLRFHGKFQATDEQLKSAWNSLLLHIPQDRYDLLHRLAPRYRLYLLSNTNSLHKEAFEKSVYQHTHQSLPSYFIDTYYSHEIGLRKPNTACYEYVLHHSNLLPQETLFVDDNELNTLNAALLGIHTIHLQEFERLIPMLHEVIDF